MKKIENIKISTEYIKLDQFLKWVGICESGVEAKKIIVEEKIKINGEIEVRRGRKIYPKYRVEIGDRTFIIE